jgi:hypothetical protein
MLALVEAHHFTIDLSRLDAVGIGTLLLALATFWLAWKTRALAQQAEQDRQTAERQVETAQHQLATAREALDADFRPVVTSVPRRSDREDVFFPRSGTRTGFAGRVFVCLDADTALLSVPIRNVGRGVALIPAGWIDLRGRGLKRVRSYDDITLSSLGTGEESRVLFEVAAHEDCHAELAAAIAAGRIEFGVLYTDVGGRQAAVTTFTIEHDAARSGHWVALKVGITLPGEELDIPPGAYPTFISPEERWGPGENEIDALEDAFEPSADQSVASARSAAMPGM